MKSIQPSRRDFGSGGIFPGVKTPGYFQASFPDAKTDGPCEPPADAVAPKRSLGHWRFGCYNHAAPLALRGEEGRKDEAGRFSRFRVVRGEIALRARWLGLQAHELTLQARRLMAKALVLWSSADVLGVQAPVLLPSADVLEASARVLEV